MAMLRVKDKTRDRLMKLADHDFGGAPVDEVVQHLLDAHWQLRAVDDADSYREQDPQGWDAYLAEAQQWDTASAPISDGGQENPAAGA